MTRKSSKANNSGANAGAKAVKEKRGSKEPEVERFRTMDELNDEFDKRRSAGFKSLSELTKNFKQQPGPEAKEPKKPADREEDTKDTAEKLSGNQGTGVLKKIFEGRGFGFVAPDQDNVCGDIFLHFSDIASGGARSLGVGTKVRYTVEPDAASGRLRAKNVSIISDNPPAVASDGPSSQVQKSSEGTTTAVSTTARAYSRDIMLGVLKALAGSSRLKNVNRLKFSTVPMPPTAPCAGGDQENPYLDDERLIARLEARLDQETGADDMNMQTFGACSGWSFEEALAANEKLRTVSKEIGAPTDIEKMRTVSEDSKQSGSSTAATFSELADASELEESSEESAGRRKGRKERTWSWEESCEEAKQWHGNRQTWEVKQKKQVVSTAAPQFQ